MKLLDGKKLADEIKEDLQDEVAVLKALGKTVRLAVIQVGNDPASSVYVKNKQKACEYCGIESSVYHVIDDAANPDTVMGEILFLINRLNNDINVNGILVQLPLPDYIDERAVLSWISPEKDVDGFHEVNAGKLMIGSEDAFVPCPARGIIEQLKANDVELEGKHCVVVGRSNIVGKPVAMELLRENATVTVCHSKTHGLKYICRDADVLICAIGRAKFFNRKYIRPGVVIVEVGIHRDPDTGKLCGDVDYEDVVDMVDAITPVPGGVGPMTVAMLMANVVEAAKREEG